MALLCRYLHSDDSTVPPRPAQGRGSWLPPTPLLTAPPPQGRLLMGHHSPLLNASAALPVQAVSRKLYRLLRWARALPLQRRRGYGPQLAQLPSVGRR